MNWRTLTMPLRLIEYVMAHEICHLVGPNPGRPFWRPLGIVLPGWEERRTELRATGARCMW